MELTKSGKDKLALVRKSGNLSGVPPLDYAILVAVDETDSLEDVIGLCKTCRTYTGTKIRASAEEVLRRIRVMQKSGMIN